MALFKMQRNFQLNHLGHGIRFEKDKEVFVPPALHAEAMKYGAIPVNEDEIEISDDTPKRRKLPEGMDRMETIIEACKLLKDENDADKFGANGLPKVKAVVDITNFDVSAKERDQAWGLMMNRSDDDS